MLQKPRMVKEETNAANGLTYGHAAATVATKNRHQHDNGVDAAIAIIHLIKNPQQYSH